jgi:hypothetical protein
MSWLSMGNGILGSTKFVCLLLLICVWNENFYSLALEDHLHHRNLPNNAWADGEGYGTKSKGPKSQGMKPYPPPALHPTPPPALHPTPPPALSPINKLCFTELAAIWWSWYICYYVEFNTLTATCPVQDQRIPAKTTFLFYDAAQNCTDFTVNERTCEIPADHWIILPAAANLYSTDFVSPGNTLDTPEGSIAISNTAVDGFTNVTATIDNVTFVPPRYESQDLCSPEILDIKGCTGAGPFSIADGWNVFSDAYWLRIPPLGNGTHTIEVTNKRSDGGVDSCSGTKYRITTV